MQQEGPSEETAEGEEGAGACTQWILPAVEFQGLWPRSAAQADKRHGWILTDPAALPRVIDPAV